jgi:hypothetical protein
LGPYGFFKHPGFRRVAARSPVWRFRVCLRSAQRHDFRNAWRHTWNARGSAARADMAPKMKVRVSSMIVLEVCPSELPSARKTAHFWRQKRGSALRPRVSYR